MMWKWSLSFADQGDNPAVEKQRRSSEEAGGRELQTLKSCFITLYCNALWATSRNQSFVHPFMFSTGIFKISIYVIPIAVLKNLLKIWEKSGGGFWDLWPKKCPGVQYSRQALSGEKEIKRFTNPSLKINMIWKLWFKFCSQMLKWKCWKKNLEKAPGKSN